MTALYDVARALQVFDLICSFCCFSFFAYQRLAKRRCKFEVLFVTFVGGFSDLMKITIAGEVPASFSVGNSDRTVMWSRWAGWLSTCPVLLIHLSNLAGKEVFNARRMMKMLIAFQVLMMCGITASMIETEWKYAFYLGGVSMISVIFKFAAEIFREAIATMPERAKNHLIRMAIVFFGSWSGFGFFFLLGPEMSNLVEKGVMLVGFAICDNISKNVYAWHGWYLRWNILRKHDKPEEFIEEDSKEVKQDYRVLLVETDPMFLYYFENILQHHNCKIDVASTTDVMMKKLEASVELDHEYDIMLVSFAMAKLNGFYLVKQVRTIAFMLPVIAYGRDIKPADMRSRNVSGIDDYIKAPFSDEEISTKMVRWSRRMSVDMTALTRVLTMNDKTRNSMSMPVDDSRDSLQSWEEHPNEGSTPAGHSSGLPMVQEQPIGTRPPEPDPAPNTSLDDPTSSKSLYTKLDLLLQQLEALKANQMRTSSAIEARLQATEMRVQHLSAQSSPRSASPMPMPAFTFTNPVAQPYAPPANPPPMAVPEPRSASPMPMPASTFTNPVARPYAPPANPAPMAVPESLHSPQSNQSLEAQYEALFAQAQEMMKRNQAAPLPPSNFA